MKLLKKLTPYLISFAPIILVVLLSNMYPVQTDWYENLAKPILQPPNWVFPVAWSIIYILLGVAGALIVKEQDWKSYTIYLINLFLNFLWTYTFFGKQMIGWAFITIVLLWISIIILMASFQKTSKKAAKLLIPYLLWVTFAAYLNLQLYILNEMIL